MNNHGFCHPSAQLTRVWFFFFFFFLVHSLFFFLFSTSVWTGHRLCTFTFFVLFFFLVFMSIYFYFFLKNSLFDILVKKTPGEIYSHPATCSSKKKQLI